MVPYLFLSNSGNSTTSARGIGDIILRGDIVLV
jgi:hypothetical protein